MGFVAKAVSSLLGGGSKPKANVQPAVDTINEEEQKNKRARSALLETAGGSAGAQLQPGQVAAKSNIYGN